MQGLLISFRLRPISHLQSVDRRIIRVHMLLSTGHAKWTVDLYAGVLDLPLMKRIVMIPGGWRVIEIGWCVDRWVCYISAGEVERWGGRCCWVCDTSEREVVRCKVVRLRWVYLCTCMGDR